MSSEQIKCQGDVGNITAVQFIFLNLNKMVGLKAGGGLASQFYVPRMYKEGRVDLMFSQKGRQIMLPTAAQS